MPEVLIISGKGGTGKTSLTAAFCHLADRPVICDLDVDAPDLHLLLQPEKKKSETFISGREALILTEKCSGCNTCTDVCKYGAISETGAGLAVNPFKCEGCGVCIHFCPEEAIAFPEKHCGDWYLSDTRFGPLVHAQLFPAEENSGRLVALLKKEAKTLAEEKGAPLILSDGPPGIGCPVISALSGADLAVIVTEPTPSGIHDLKRILELCEHFNIPAAVIINKADLNPGQARAIEGYCLENSRRVIAKLPHDKVMTEAMVQGKTVTEFQACELSDALKSAWNEIVQLAGPPKSTEAQPSVEGFSAGA
jgi:MinD superfamily P-loop ATPase